MSPVLLFTYASEGRTCVPRVLGWNFGLHISYFVIEMLTWFAFYSLLDPNLFCVSEFPSISLRKIGKLENCHVYLWNSCVSQLHCHVEPGWCDGQDHRLGDRPLEVDSPLLRFLLSESGKGSYPLCASFHYLESGNDNHPHLTGCDELMGETTFTAEPDW